MDATAPSASAAAPEPVAEPSTAAEGAQLSLKVRTLDQKTYPISVCAAASVPQLKARVALSTGVTMARQRLIFRGRVLKNDQPLTAYALEDGHVLHLVARAATPAPATSTASTTTQPRGRRGQNDAAHAGLAAHFPRARRSRRATRSRSPSSPPRDNDEPDPVLAAMDGSALNNRLLMGATITVPEGADVTMPFLSSMIANIVTSVQGQASADGSTASSTSTSTTASASTAASTPSTGRRSVTFYSGATDGPPEMEAATARVLRRHQERRDAAAAAPGATTRTHHARRSASSADRQASLRSRAEIRMASVEAALNDASLDFPANLPPVAATDTTFAALQEQVDTLQSLLERFGPRLRLLPAALAEREGQPQRVSVMMSRDVTRAIEMLQTLGEAVDLVARMVRHVFLRQTMDLRANSEHYSGPRVSRVATEAGDPNAELLRLARGRGGDSRSRMRLADAMEMLHRNPRRASVNGSAAGSTSSFPVDLTDASAASTGAATTSPAAPAASTTSTSSRSGRTSHRSRRSTANAARSAGALGAGAGPPSSGAHISISGMGGLPLMSSVVFPFSLAAGLHGAQGSTTWNLADLVSRLAAELPAATLYGVLTGDAASVHRVMAHVGYALLSGVDVPRLSRAQIRTWTQDLVAELRRLLRSHALPGDVLALVNGPSTRRSALGDELVRAVEPFLPELADLLFRATSASRAAAFGASSSTFLGTMARQVVRQVRAYIQGDGPADDVAQRLEQVLQGVLGWMGLDDRMARFAVANLLASTHEDAHGDGRRTATSARSERSRRRRESATGRDAADGPATKRRRQ